MGSVLSLGYKHTCKKKEKFQAWTSGPATSALQGMATWHVTKQLLTKIKRWEFSWLRKLLRLRRRAAEGQFDYNTRTANIIIQWSYDFNCKLMHHRILLDVFKAAWRETMNYPDGIPHLNNVRRFRDRHWWDGVRMDTHSPRCQALDWWPACRVGGFVCPGIGGPPVIDAQTLPSGGQSRINL